MTPSNPTPSIPTKTIVITLDGPAGAGKSTIARELAKRLGYSYLDTGAMYRALTLKALEQKIVLTDEDALEALAKTTLIDLKVDSHQALRIYLDGRDVTVDIRSLEVTNHTFYIARAPKVRGMMVEWQRHIGQKTNVVVEGRDVGTVVFPKATRKFYLDADVHERSRRRVAELRLSGKHVEDAQVLRELQERDQKDLTRKVGPLRKAVDAVLIDSTHLTIDQVVGKMLELVK